MEARERAEQEMLLHIFKVLCQFGGLLLQVRWLDSSAPLFIVGCRGSID
jgi:hypothetical protein